MNSTQRKIIDFGALPEGWHYKNGKPPNSDTIATALLFEHVINIKYDKTNAFPGENGEIMVTGYNGDKYIEISIEVDNTYNLCKKENSNEIYAEKANMLDAVEFVDVFGE